MGLNTRYMCVWKLDPSSYFNMNIGLNTRYMCVWKLDPSSYFNMKIGLNTWYMCVWTRPFFLLTWTWTLAWIHGTCVCEYERPVPILLRRFCGASAAQRWPCERPAASAFFHLRLLEVVQLLLFQDIEIWVGSYGDRCSFGKWCCKATSDVFMQQVQLLQLAFYGKRWNQRQKCSTYNRCLKAMIAALCFACVTSFIQRGMPPPPKGRCLMSSYYY